MIGGDQAGTQCSQTKSKAAFHRADWCFLNSYFLLNSKADWMVTRITLFKIVSPKVPLRLISKMFQYKHINI